MLSNVYQKLAIYTVKAIREFQLHCIFDILDMKYCNVAYHYGAFDD